MEGGSTNDAIVLYPAPGIGHLVSMVELGRLILSHYPDRFSITILLTTGLLDTPALGPYIRRISDSHPAISFRRFPFQHVDTAPARSGGAVAFDFIRLNRPNVAKALRDISDESSAVRAFVIDFFCTSALDVAKDLGIPTYYFFTSGAAVLAAFSYLPKICEETTRSFKDMDHDVEIELPGMPPLNAHHMPEPILDRDDPAYWDFLYFCSNLAKSDGIIVNTFDGLEPIPIKALADGVCVPEGPTPPVYCIGPLIDESGEKVESIGSVECLSWLDTQPSRSVVFLCFGSRGSFSAAQIKEIAEGLERSQQRFLWVVKKPPSDEMTKQTMDLGDDFDWEGLFPEGFAERTKGRGVVVRSWAPQVAVLRKEAVGGFVTHCGWNSMLEAVVAGVPMVAWPLYAEQHMNRNVTVKDLRVAVAVEQREGDGFVSGDEVEKKVRELMESEHGKEIRQESLRMRVLALAALEESGSSAVALQKFVECLIKTS